MSKGEKNVTYAACSLSSNNFVIENDKPTIDFDDIVNKKWKVFRVSPMYNFKVDKLKVYENALCEELIVARSNYLMTSYKTSFCFNEKVTLSEYAIKVLKVQVTSNESKSIYLGYFISYDQSEDSHSFISLPALLVEAKDHVAQEIHYALCKMFDCDIQPITFSFVALITFLVKLLETPQKSIPSSQEVLYLEYKIPGCPIQDAIKVTLMLEDITIILAVVIDNLRDKIRGITNMEIIVEFYNRILNHIFNIYKLDLMLAELHKIIFPYAFIALDGQVKISKNVAGVVFNILQKTCKPIQQF